jgi:hypothetical protein
MTTFEVAMNQSKKVCGERLSGWGWTIYNDGTLSNYHQLGNFCEEGDSRKIGEIDELKLEDHTTRDWGDGDEEPGSFEDYQNVIEWFIQEAKEIFNVK